MRISDRLAFPAVGSRACQRLFSSVIATIDGPSLQSEISSQSKDFDVARANDEDALKKVCEEGADLLLVNREPVGFDDTDGIRLIAELRKDYPDQKMMLVSDYQDAQQDAVKKGALPGFGKADMGTGKLAKVLREALS